MSSVGRHLLALAAISVLILSSGCSDRDLAGLEIAIADTDPVVFDDAYGTSIYFQPFFQTVTEAVQVDDTYAYQGFADDGARSLRIDVPPKGSSLGLYAGGVLTASGKRDFTDYNALTFYARSNADISMDVFGYGNDNTGTSLYEAGRGAIPLANEWTFVVVPIPSPSRLIGEQGMFTFAEGLEQQPANSGIFPYPDGYSIWLDEIRFAKLDNIEVFRASMRSVNQQYFVGTTVTVQNTSTIFLVDGDFVPVEHAPGYFDYFSSDTSVAKVDQGVIEIVGVGQSTIKAQLLPTVADTVDVIGTITVTGNLPPMDAAPSPTVPAGDVISMFSDVYDDVPVDTWRADWGGSTAVLSEYMVGGSNTKMYSALNFVGILFENPRIDASQMTHLHMDVYAPAGTTFRVKLVSFPPDLTVGVETGDLILDSNSVPAFNAGSWSLLEIPLTDFQLPADWDWGQVGQMVLSTSDAQLVLVDNVYWHK